MFSFHSVGAFFDLDDFVYLKHAKKKEQDPEDDAEDEGGEEEQKEEYAMTYSYDGPWHHPQPQTLTASVMSEWPEETGDFAMTIQVSLASPIPTRCRPAVAVCGVYSWSLQRPSLSLHPTRLVPRFPVHALALGIAIVMVSSTPFRSRSRSR